MVAEREGIPFRREKIDSEESMLIPKRIYLTFMVMKLTNRRVWAGELGQSARINVPGSGGLPA